MRAIRGARKPKPKPLDRQECARRALEANVARRLARQEALAEERRFWDWLIHCQRGLVVFDKKALRALRTP